MSLQLDLILRYIELQASLQDMEKIMVAIKGAEATQHKRHKEAMDGYWDQTYKDWLREEHGIVLLEGEHTSCLTEDRYRLILAERKVPLVIRELCGSYYICVLGVAKYSLKVTKESMELRLNDSERDKCRVHVDYEGGHEGCARDGCREFDDIIEDQTKIEYLIKFAFGVHNKVIDKRIELARERIQLPEVAVDEH